MNGDTRTSSSTPVRTQTSEPQEVARRSVVRTTAPQVCDDCRALTAFHAWHDINLTPSFNWEVDFADYGIPPPGKRAVIELVTAQILVPQGEWVRLRMFTSLGMVASNIDLYVTQQGIVSGQAIYVATHSIRVYSDRTISFNINRDNATTTGHALICISGYVVG